MELDLDTAYGHMYDELVELFEENGLDEDALKQVLQNQLQDNVKELYDNRQQVVQRLGQ